jgi:hypothetical protein
MIESQSSLLASIVLLKMNKGVWEQQPKSNNFLISNPLQSLMTDSKSLGCVHGGGSHVMYSYRKYWTHGACPNILVEKRSKRW